ncbi:MAG: FAD-binding oxidoreductase [Actinobacteria bacterium]|nr:MAG: FAD-binding oxidoreductase [Actinomycetota bacterium]
MRAELLQLVPDESRVSTSESVLQQHGEDLSYHPPHEPDVVVFAETTEEVADVLRFANERGIAVTPFGAGTSLEGNAIPLRGGISLDLTRMTRILEVRPDDLQADVQAGVPRSALNAAAGSHGLFFPVDPGADATLGGMAATNASGTTTVRYGGMRAQVLALQVVLADGTVVHTGTRAVKSSAGYNLTALFVGSEGTLGVITELTLRLYGIPDYVVAVRAAFPDVESACRAAATMIGSGVAVSRCELVDSETIRQVNDFKGTDYEVMPHLFVEFGGSEAGVSGDLDATREIAEGEGCTSFTAERDAAARARLWDARHNALHALLHAAPGKRSYATDVCVPVSQLPDAIRLGRSLLDETGQLGHIVGHVGDGNYHIALMLDPGDPNEVARAKALNARIVDDALARGGTSTGEHGVGIGKKEFLAREHGDLLPLMRGIKQLLDPKGILNPGKLF